MSISDPIPAAASVAASTAEESIASTRAQLEETLDAIEDKLNVPKQLGRIGRKARAAYEENPVPWIIGATAAVIVVGGLIAWAIFSDD
jgi:hypothetical protein